LTDSFLHFLIRLVKKKVSSFFRLHKKTTGAILPTPDSPAIFLIKGSVEMPGRWEKIAAQRSAREMKEFAYLRLLTRALGVSHEALADKLGFIRPFDAQEALRGRREASSEDIALALLDFWRVSRLDYLDAARYMDEYLAPEERPDQV
jgi:hypothetical protein